MEVVAYDSSGTWSCEVAPAYDYRLNQLIGYLKLAYVSCMFIKLYQP